MKKGAEDGRHPSVLHRSLACCLKVGGFCKHGNIATYSFSIESFIEATLKHPAEIISQYTHIRRYPYIKMVLTKQVILTDKAPKPLSVLNQGLVVGDMVYCSGQVGTDPATGELVEGTVADRAVSLVKGSRWATVANTSVQEQVLKNL